LSFAIAFAGLSGPLSILNAQVTHKPHIPLEHGMVGFLCRTQAIFI